MAPSSSFSSSSHRKSAKHKQHQQQHRPAAAAAHAGPSAFPPRPQPQHGAPERPEAPSQAVADARARGHHGAWKLPSLDFASGAPGQEEAAFGAGAGADGDDDGTGLPAWLTRGLTTASPGAQGPQAPRGLMLAPTPALLLADGAAEGPSARGQASSAAPVSPRKPPSTTPRARQPPLPSKPDRIDDDDDDDGGNEHEKAPAGKPPAPLGRAVDASPLRPPPADRFASLRASSPSSSSSSSSSSQARRQPSLPSTLPPGKHRPSQKEMRRPSLFSLRSTTSSSGAAPPVPSTNGSGPSSTFSKIRDSVFAVLPSGSGSSSTGARSRASTLFSSSSRPSADALQLHPPPPLPLPVQAPPMVVQTPPPLSDDDEGAEEADEVLVDDSYFASRPLHRGGSRSGSTSGAPLAALGAGSRHGSGSSGSLISSSVPASPLLGTAAASSTSSFGAQQHEREPRMSAQSSPQRPASSSLLDLPTPMPASSSSAATGGFMRRPRLRPRSSTDPPSPDPTLLAPSTFTSSRSPYRRGNSTSAGSPSRPASRPSSIRRLSSSLFQSGASSSASSSLSTAGAGAGPSSQPDFAALFGGQGNKSPSKLFGRALATPPIVEDHVAPLFPPPQPHFLQQPDPSRPSSSSSSSLALTAPEGSARPMARRGSSTGSARRSSLASSTGSWTGSSARGNGRELSAGNLAGRRASDDVRMWEAEVPRREEEEGVDEWLGRLKEVVPRSEIATILASNGDDFHAAALRAYMLSFDLSLLPLDIALRRLLMEVSLPRETQQIDRVMEAFAKQYLESNPGLFGSEDHPYILAFSLIMLHTDAFNRSNKNKMTKADYVKNTRIDGVSPLVLDCFFDNITFTPFVFIEDDYDVNGSRALASDGGVTQPGPATPFASFSTTPTTSSFLATARPSSSSSTKIDVYYLISTGRVHTLRCADVSTLIPRTTPFGYHGPRGAFDTAELHAAFAEADLIEVEQPGERRGSAGSNAAASNLAHSLKLTKYGVLSRKEELSDGGKKSSNRKWKEWSVILTGSQLLFFKDTTWALVLRNQAEERSGAADGGKVPGQGGRLLLPKMANFKPDEILSVKDCIAVTDTTYSKYPNAFRFVMPHGRQYILQTSDADELSDWLSRINYAAAFKTALVRMRGMGMTGGQAQLAGAAAAASHAKALKSSESRSGSLDGSVKTVDSAFFSATQNREYGRPRASTSTAGSAPSPPSLPSISTSALAPPSPRTGFASRLRSSSSKPLEAILLDSPVGPSVDSGEQLESAFIEVKAELAAGRGGVPRLSVGEQGGRARAASVGGLLETPLASARASFEDGKASFEKVHGGLGVEMAEFGGLGRSNHASRAEAIQLKVDQLKSRIRTTEQALDAELRTTRNLAILAPFRKASRERIALAVPPLAKRIRTLRLELARFRCYEEILEKDLRIEENEWKLVKHIAHQAAASSLSGKRPHVTPPRPLAVPPPHLAIPDLEISMHTGTTPPPVLGGGRRASIPPFSPSKNAPPSTPTHGLRRVSSTISDASFHSALDEFTVPLDDLPEAGVGDEGDLPPCPPPQAPSHPPKMSHSAPPSRRPSTDQALAVSAWPTPLQLDASGPPTPPHASRLLPSHAPSRMSSATPSVAEEESAEPWSRTRAGKRVSLAEVPTETVRRISLQLKRDSVEDMRRRAARESRQAVGKSGLSGMVDGLRGAAHGEDGGRLRAPAQEAHESDNASMLTVNTVTPASQYDDRRRPPTPHIGPA